MMENKPKVSSWLTFKKAKKTVCTVHEDKRHIYQEGDFVKLVEVEGMVEINYTEPLKIVATTKDGFTLEHDSTNYSDYAR